MHPSQSTMTASMESVCWPSNSIRQLRGQVAGRMAQKLDVDMVVLGISKPSRTSSTASEWMGPSPQHSATPMSSSWLDPSPSSWSHQLRAPLLQPRPGAGPGQLSRQPQQQQQPDITNRSRVQPPHTSAFDSPSADTAADLSAALSDSPQEPMGPDPQLLQQLQVPAQAPTAAAAATVAAPAVALPLRQPAPAHAAGERVRRGDLWQFIRSALSSPGPAAAGSQPQGRSAPAAGERVPGGLSSQSLRDGLGSPGPPAAGSQPHSLVFRKSDHDQGRSAPAAGERVPGEILPQSLNGGLGSSGPAAAGSQPQGRSAPAAGRRVRVGLLSQSLRGGLGSPGPAAAGSQPQGRSALRPGASEVAASKESSQVLEGGTGQQQADAPRAEAAEECHELQCVCGAGRLSRAKTDGVWNLLDAYYETFYHLAVANMRRTAALAAAPQQLTRWANLAQQCEAGLQFVVTVLEHDRDKPGRGADNALVGAGMDKEQVEEMFQGINDASGDLVDVLFTLKRLDKVRAAPERPTEAAAAGKASAAGGAGLPTPAAAAATAAMTDASRSWHSGNADDSGAALSESADSSSTSVSAMAGNSSPAAGQAGASSTSSCFFNPWAQSAGGAADEQQPVTASDAARQGVDAASKDGKQQQHCHSCHTSLQQQQLLPWQGSPLTATAIGPPPATATPTAVATAAMALQGRLLSQATNNSLAAAVELLSWLRKGPDKFWHLRWEQLQPQISGQLGEGSYGKVYKGNLESADVAVKMIIMDDGDVLQFLGSTLPAFKKEVDLSRRLNHPSMVQFLGACCDLPLELECLLQAYHQQLAAADAMARKHNSTTSSSNNGAAESAPADAAESALADACLKPRIMQQVKLAIVMQLCDLGNLFKMIQDARMVARWFQSGVSQQQACSSCRHGFRFYKSWLLRLEVLHGIAAGVQYMHSQRVVHRDLTSYNVLLESGDFWKAKVCDFNLSRALGPASRLTNSGNINSPAWASPEVLGGKDYGPQVDVFSLGVIIWEVVTLKVPWEEVLRKDGKRGTWRVMCAVRQGKRLSWTDADSEALTLIQPEYQGLGQLIQLAEACWREVPKDRPTMCEVAATLGQLIKQGAAAP